MNGRIPKRNILLNLIDRRKRKNQSALRNMAYKKLCPKEIQEIEMVGEDRGCRRTRIIKIKKIIIIMLIKKTLNH